MNWEQESKRLYGVCQLLQIENAELKGKIERLQQEHSKLIEGLRYFMKEFGKIPVSPATAGAGHAYKKMLSILAEIGVKVE